MVAGGSGRPVFGLTSGWCCRNLLGQVTRMSISDGNVLVAVTGVVVAFFCGL